MKYLFVIFSICYFSTKLLAQESCQEKLLRTNSLYDQGKIPEAIELIKPCTVSDKATDQWQAYRLLTMSYLANNQQSEAMQAGKKLLELNPRYEPNLLGDPKDFTVLLSRIDVIPKFSLGLSVIYGGNFTFPQIDGVFAPTDYTKEYKGKTGYQLGLVAGYNFTKHHGIDFSLISNSKKYSLEYKAYEGSGPEVKIDETINSFDFPLLYRYSFTPIKRLGFGLDLGPYGSWMVNSYNDLSISENGESTEVKHYSSKVRRNVFNYGICMGAGITYKWKAGHFSLDGRYYKAMSNITYEEGRYENATLIYDYSYLDDDIMLDNLAISLGYHLYINYKIAK